jgi:hypothetical protein
VELAVDLDELPPDVIPVGSGDRIVLVFLEIGPDICGTDLILEIWVGYWPARTWALIFWSRSFLMAEANSS